jgi:hypothetical protein
MHVLLHLVSHTLQELVKAWLRVLERGAARRGHSVFCPSCASNRLDRFVGDGPAVLFRFLGMIAAAPSAVLLSLGGVGLAVAGGAGLLDLLLDAGIGSGPLISVALVGGGAGAIWLASGLGYAFFFCRGLAPPVRCRSCGHSFVLPRPHSDLSRSEVPPAQGVRPEFEAVD